jgi:hypothetical protein
MAELLMENITYHDYKPATLLLFALRVAAVALRLTELGESAARFQALSAISGAGFTTKESEFIVNYPVRRQIVSILIIIGNLGLVTVMATLVASLVQTEGELSGSFSSIDDLKLGDTLVLYGSDPGHDALEARGSHRSNAEVLK